jgi:hypothetical protein
LGAPALPRASDALQGSVIAMKRKPNGHDAAALHVVYVEFLKCRRAHAAAVARWREQAPRVLRGQAAALWRKTEELARQKRELGQALRKKAKPFLHGVA